MKPKNLSLRYGMTQFSYWAAAPSAVSFATTYLLGRGLPAGAIGTILAVAGLLSCVTQPVLASIADRSKDFLLTKMLLVMTMLCAVCFSAQLFTQLPTSAIGLCYLIGIWCFDAMVPLLNALCITYNEAGYPINYGATRGAGAMATAAASLVLGFILAQLGSVWMLVFILSFCLLLLLALMGFPNIRKPVLTETIKTQKGSDTILHFLSRYRWYCASLIGVMFLAMYHAMTENYLIAIMGRLGGDSSNVGSALFISSMSAALVLFFFNAIRTHIPDTTLLKIAALSYLLKAVLFYFARSIPVLYLLQLIQLTSYSFLVPTLIFYANQKVRKADMVKGQAFGTAAYALGCSAGNFAGGQLLGAGVDAILMAGIMMAVIGTIIMFLTVNKAGSYKPCGEAAM